MVRIDRLTRVANFDRFLGDDAARAGAIQEFCESLQRAEMNPQWAVEQAIDRWIDTKHRMPSPGELRTTLAHILEPFTAEIARRQKLAKAQVEFEEANKRDVPSADVAQAICDRAGFTAKRIADIQAAPPTVAPTDIEAGAGHTASQKVPYSERRHPDDIRISRLRNTIMRESMGLTEAQAQAEIDAILNGRSQEDAA